MTRLAVFALLSLLLVVPPVRADQFEFVSLPQAQAALRHLHRGDVVHHFCAPCDDTKSERMTIRNLGIDRIWDTRGSSRVYRDTEGGTWWQVQLNDAGIDLAYVYVRDGRRWRNLADVLGLHPWHVPSVLPAASVGTRWRCGTRYDNPYETILNARRDPCPLDVEAHEAAASDKRGAR